MEVRQTGAFRDWRENLPDSTAHRRIAVRIERIQAGLLGDAKSVGDGVSEVRIDYGPGYRLYFTRREGVVVILLCGGDKGSQKRDIVRAKALAADLLE